jgi:4-carboxymuconolactone decarboxylase
MWKHESRPEGKGFVARRWPAVQPAAMSDQATKAEYARLARTLARADAAAQPLANKGKTKRGGGTPPAKTPGAANRRRARGLRLNEEIVGIEGARVLNRLAEISPALARDIVDFAYGEVLAEGRLDARTRALVVVGALAALGSAQPQLKVHLGSALRAGCTREEIAETMRLVALYAGFPAALNGIAAARDALAAQRPVRRRPRKN